MKIKNKIRLGFGFIFAIVLVFGAMSVYFISQLSNSAKVILKNNYETLSFTKEMRTVLDENKIPLSTSAISAFDKQLVKQEHNVTEKGEDVATADLRKAFNVLQSTAGSLAIQENAVHDARTYLRKIEDLNMQAIVSKTDTAQTSVNNAVLILGITGCITFLILFSFSVNISSIVSGPVIELESGLEEIGQDNYNHRLNFNENDEFGKISTAFNAMAERLKNLEYINLTESLAEKQRLETIIEQFEGAIVIVNEKQKVLFINKAAKSMLNVHQSKLTDEQASDFATSNTAFKSILKSDSAGNPIKIEHDGKESTFKLESMEVSVPNITRLKTDEINVARLSAGKIYLLRDISKYQEI